MLTQLRRKKHAAGFASFVEVVVTAILFVLAALGIFTSISMLRPHGAEADRRLEAAYIGKRVIEELRGQVDTRMWDNAQSSLYPGSHSKTIGDYMANWTVEDNPSLGIRHISMEVFYLEE